MIKSIRQVLKELEPLDQYTKAVTLKLWAESIVNECRANFECSWESNDDCLPEELNKEDIKIGYHPVLMRMSIEVVKNQIK